MDTVNLLCRVMPNRDLTAPHLIRKGFSVNRPLICGEFVRAYFGEPCTGDAVLTVRRQNLRGNIILRRQWTPLDEPHWYLSVRWGWKYTDVVAGFNNHTYTLFRDMVLPLFDDTDEIRVSLYLEAYWDE